MSMTRRFLLLFCAAVFLVSCVSFAVFAEDASISYVGKAEELIFEPGSDHSPTDLFGSFKNVMPGAKLTQKITLKNKVNDEVKVKIYLRSLGSEDEKYNEFLNQLTLTVSADSESPLFSAPADKPAALSDWVCLGTLYSGASLDLDVTLDVPTTLDNMFQNMIGKIKWQFVAEEYPVEEPKWKCPKDESHRYHIEIIDGIAVFVCDDCDETEHLKCDVCGGDMREVLMITIEGKTYIVHHVGDDHYQTDDGRVHFYFNDENIIEYYIVDGVKTDIRDVSKYKIYQYYECVDNSRHHTDPQPPPTGDSSDRLLWILLAVISGCVILLLLFAKRRKHDDEAEVRSKC